MDARHAVVFGAGIGGLTAARALVDVGWRVTVLERAPALEPVGSGVGLMPNALRGLDRVGVGEAVRELAALGSGGIRRPDGRWLLRTDNEEVRARFGDAVVVLRRSDVVDLLARGLPGIVRTSTCVTGVQPGDRHRRARVGTAEGEVEADLVVAADGANSTTRRALFPDHPGLAYSGATAWRVIGAPPGWEGVASETWGRGQVAGVMPLADGCVYGYFTALAPAGTRAPDERTELRQRFGTWHAPIPDLVDSAEPDDFLRNDVWWLAEPLPSLHRGRVAMLGDSAHPMAPNLGQGACQAVEDAVTLAHAVGPAGDADVPAGLARYTTARLRRGADVARRSARASAVVNSESRLRAGLRDLALAAIDRIAPQLFYGVMRPSVDWSPP